MWKQSVCYILAFCIIAKSPSSYCTCTYNPSREWKKNMHNFMVIALDATAKVIPRKDF